MFSMVLTRDILDPPTVPTSVTWTYIPLVKNFWTLFNHMGSRVELRKLNIKLKVKKPEARAIAIIKLYPV